MKKVLLVDTSFSSAPIHDCLVQEGFEVFVCGGNPADFLARVSANYINMDYSNVAETRALVDSLGIDYVVPGCNDRSYQVCAALNSAGRFPGLDGCGVTETISNKRQFREFAARTGLPVPCVISCGQVGDAWPVIVKPVDAYSGRGVSIVSQAERGILPAAIQQAEAYSRSRTCIIEEYVEGQLYSHSAFISNGVIQIDFVVEEHGTANPFVVDTSRVIYDFPDDMLARIRENVSAMVTQLGLVDGLLHTQFVRNGDAYWLIEVTRRCPGDLYSQLIESSTGFCYAEAYIKPFTGQAPVLGDQELAQHFVMRHTVSQSTEIVLGALHFNMPVQIEKLVPLSLAGDTIKASPFGRIALLFARSRSEEEFSELFEATLGRALYSIH